MEIQGNAIPNTVRGGDLRLDDLRLGPAGDDAFAFVSRLDGAKTASEWSHPAAVSSVYDVARREWTRFKRRWPLWVGMILAMVLFCRLWVFGGFTNWIVMGIGRGGIPTCQ